MNIIEQINRKRYSLIFRIRALKQPPLSGGSIIINENGTIDKTLYVIRRNPSAGFFSNYFYVLSHIVEIVHNQKKDEIDFYVDFEKYKTLYSELHKIHGTNNAWNYYFDNNVKNLKDYSKIVYTSNEFLYNVPCYSVRGRKAIFPNHEMVTFLNEQILDLVPFNDYVMRFAKKDLECIKHCVTLGIHIRGTDMKEDSTHPNPFDVNNLIAFFESTSIVDRYDKVLICSDEQNVIDFLTHLLPDKVFSFNSYRAKESNRGIHTVYKWVRKNHRYKLGLEVCRDALCLSECSGLICSPSNVAYAAIVFNNNRYKELFVFDGKSFIQH